MLYLFPSIFLYNSSHIFNTNRILAVNMNRIIASGFFKPVEKLNIVAAIGSIGTSIMIDVNKFNTINNIVIPINPRAINLNNSFSFVYAFTMKISFWCRSYIIYPKFNKSFLLYNVWIFYSIINSSLLYSQLTYLG